MNALMRLVMVMAVLAFFVVIPSAGISVAQGVWNPPLVYAWFTFLGAIAVWFSLLMLGLIFDVDMY